MREVNRKEWEISSSLAIADYAIQNGFKNIVSVEKGYGGKPFAVLDDKLYVLVKDPDGGVKLDFSSYDDMINFTRTMASFHNSVEGFNQPKGLRVKAQWGKSIERYRSMSNNLEKYHRNIELKGPASEFEKLTKDKIEQLVKRAKCSTKIFRSLSYLRVLEKSMIMKEICINSISESTAVKTQDGIVITGIFDLGYNLQIEDLGETIKKVIGKTGEVSLYNELVNEYSNIRYLDESSILILNAIVSFPYDTIRMINRYLEKKEDENILIDKFVKYYEKECNCDIWGEKYGV